MLQTSKNDNNTKIIKLSQILPHFYTNSQSINLSNRKIIQINQIDPKYTKLLQINFSHNQISSIKHIKQFTMLKILDLSYNQIQNQQEIHLLTQLNQLEQVILIGNPFLNKQLSNQTKKILQRLRGSQQESFIYQQQQMVNNLQGNYRRLAYIQLYYKKIEIHIEMFNTYGLENFPNPQVKSFIKFINKMIDSIENDIKDKKYINKFKFEAYNVRKTLNLQDMYSAYQYLNQKQIERKQQLIKSIQNKYNQFRLIRINNIKKQKNQILKPIKQILINSNKNNQSKTNHQYLSKNPRQSPEKQPQKKYQTLYYKNLTKKNPVYHLLYSPLHSLKTKQKDLLIECLSSNLKQKTIQLYKKQDILKKYEQNNVLESKKYFKEIHRLQDQMKVKDKMMNELQREVKQLRNRLRLQIELKNSELIKIEEKNKRMKQDREKQGQIQEIILSMRYKNLGSKYLRLMIQRGKIMKNVNRLYDKNILNWNKLLMKQGISILKINIKQNKLTKIKKLKSIQSALKYFIQSSKYKHKIKHIQHKILTNQFTNLMRQYQLNSSQNIHQHKLKSILKYHRQHSFIIKFKQIYQNNKKCKMQNIKQHNKKITIIRYFNKWIQMVQDVKKSNKMNENRIIMNRKKRYLRQLMQGKRIYKQLRIKSMKLKKKRVYMMMGYNKVRGIKIGNRTREVMNRLYKKYREIQMRLGYKEIYLSNRIAGRQLYKRVQIMRKQRIQNNRVQIFMNRINNKNKYVYLYAWKTYTYKSKNNILTSMLQQYKHKIFQYQLNQQQLYTKYSINLYDLKLKSQQVYILQQKIQSNQYQLLNAQLQIQQLQHSTHSIIHPPHHYQNISHQTPKHSYYNYHKYQTIKTLKH